MKNNRAMGALSWAAGLAVSVVVGCSHEQTPPRAVPGTQAPMGVTSQQNQADQRVVEQLASARCDREQNCKNIGNGQKYASREACMEQNRGSSTNDLNAYDCPRGIDATALDKCLSTIRKASCGLSLDNISLESDCRSGALCMK